jgi:nucleotide-binding universal stress UspA family protein
MKIVLAADGSNYTKKALAVLVTHEEIVGADGEVILVNVQPAMPPRVRSMVGAEAVAGYHREESEKVLKPISKFLDRHGIKYGVRTAVGHPGVEIVKAAKKEKAHLIVMGTHGHGILGRALLGSVAQNVITDCEIPVLMVK